MKSLLTLMAVSVLAAPAAFAAGDKGASLDVDLPTRSYEVTITNITRGQSFTPVLAVSHNRKISLFELGATPSQELADIAEGGDTSGMMDLLAGLPELVLDMAGTTDGLIFPGQSRTITIKADLYFNRLSLAGMLLPTNDTFVAVNSMRLPDGRAGATAVAIAYDAGSEENDELCANIPGPTCGGAPFSEGLAEGYVHVSNGISGEGDLESNAYDWRNPVAIVMVRRSADIN